MKYIRLLLCSIPLYKYYHCHIVKWFYADKTVTYNWNKMYSVTYSCGGGQNADFYCLNSAQIPILINIIQLKSRL